MLIIGDQSLWTISRTGKAKKSSCTTIRRSPSFRVSNYKELATKVAELQFRNPDYVLLFRGQSADFRRTTSLGLNLSTLAPSLFRMQNGNWPSSKILQSRFRKLTVAEQDLTDEYEHHFGDTDKLKRQQILRWSILQHYEICRTPLLDVTQSVRIAASFATDKTKSVSHVFVLGVPFISGAITASAEAGIQIVRLASVCPPEALRPHIQEGYLLGEYPELSTYDRKQNYYNWEVDFGRRLIAKFSFDPKEFWDNSEDFPEISRNALFPDKDDPMFELAERIRRRIAR